MWRLFSICWLFILAPQQAPAEEPVRIQMHGAASLWVEAPVRDQRVQIGLADLLKLNLRVEGSSRLQVDRPVKITQSPGWKIVNVGDVETRPLDNSRQAWLLAVTLEPLAPGESVLQLGELRYRDGDNAQTVKWDIVGVSVSSSIADPDLRNLREPIGIEDQSPATRPSWLVWLVVTICAGGTGLAYFLVARWGRQKEVAVSAHKTAVREIERILTMNLPEKGRVNLFHTLLANVVRRFLEKTQHVPARRQTTAEFLDAIARSSNLSVEKRTFLAGFLERCDLAKFAGVSDIPDRCRQLADEARRFVASLVEAASEQRRDSS